MPDPEAIVTLLDGPGAVRGRAMLDATAIARPSSTHFQSGRSEMKHIVVAAVLALAPGLAIAGCGHDRVKTTATSCAEGQVWDSKTMACVPQPQA
jgi:hypothetical protein